MKNLLLLATILFSTINANAEEQVDYYTQKQNEIEIKRIDQTTTQLQEVLELQAKQLRELEMANKKLTEDVKAAQQRADDLIDLWINFENVTLPNLTEADKSLAQRINQTNRKITENDPIWNWGHLTRDCPNLGKHQQVKTIQSTDKSANITYMCFDGKVMHLKTTSNLPPAN